ncbi:tautomerase family protein [Burkholderia cenocepacia]|uniref:tautomerase family protein n=1 Tax=Burkholderia cenocepacia TaxID=95486 RepID=UPI002B252EF1|nr:tautomerase family protein [Burkholderia cenocepacia]MEB2542993.1 tautomerase family protein [Burkholderia cenocepacia]
MPTLEVFLPAGHDAARKAELIARLTGATVDAIGAPIESVRVLLTELPATHIGLGGRTDEQKRALIAALSDAGAHVLDAPLQATRVIIKDIPNTDFGIGGQTARALGR